jgi:hypothetical protein
MTKDDVKIINRASVIVMQREMGSKARAPLARQQAKTLPEMPRPPGYHSKLSIACRLQDMATWARLALHRQAVALYHRSKRAASPVITAPGGQFFLQHLGKLKYRSAGQAGKGGHGTMKFDNGDAAGFLMQAVDVLRDNAMQKACLFHSG